MKFEASREFLNEVWSLPPHSTNDFLGLRLVSDSWANFIANDAERTILRWFIDGIGSPVIGAVADRIGRQRSILFLFPLNALVLAAVSSFTRPVPMIFFIILFFICSTALMTLLSTQAGQGGPRAVASYATAIDLGMAVGPIIGWSIAQFEFPADSIFLSC